MVGGVGDDPRRRAACPRFRVTGRGRRSGRDGSRCGATAAAAGADRAGFLRRPGLGPFGRLAGIRRPAAGAGPRREPGSDHQLAFVNALCSSVLSTRHVVVLADLLDHDPADLGLAGLSIDTDLRWRIVTALAAAGDIDADGPETPFIDAEVQRDPTAAGKRHGAQASAARPQLAVKEKAWSQVTEDDTLPNIVGRSIIAGFVEPGQAELLKPFGARYFAAIPGIWERRSSEVAQTVVVGLYPSWDISDDGIAAADEFLADPGLPPALRRLVLEGRAGVERSLRARGSMVAGRPDGPNPATPARCRRWSPGRR